MPKRHQWKENVASQDLGRIYHTQHHDTKVYIPCGENEKYVIKCELCSEYVCVAYSEIPNGHWIMLKEKMIPGVNWLCKPCQLYGLPTLADIRSLIPQVEELVMNIL